MKNSLKSGLLALAIAGLFSFTACDPNGTGKNSSKNPVDTGKNIVDTAKSGDTTKTGVDTVRKDSVKK